MKKIKGSYLFKISGSDGSVVEWLVDLKSGSGSVTKSPGTTTYMIKFYYYVRTVSTAQVPYTLLCYNVIPLIHFCRQEG